MRSDTVCHSSPPRPPTRPFEVLFYVKFGLSVEWVRVESRFSDDELYRIFFFVHIVPDTNR